MTKDSGEKTWLSRWSIWVQKASAKHNARYQYPSPERVLDCRVWKVRIVCPEHGEFLQAPAKHLYGRACPKCSGLGTDKVALLRSRFPENDWSHLGNISSKEYIDVCCKKHGQTKSRYNRLMQKRDGLPACSKCAREISGVERRVDISEWARRVSDKHGDLVILKSESIEPIGKASFACKLHGDFEANVRDIAGGHGCPACGSEKRKAWEFSERRVGVDEFIERARAVHGAKYEYDASTLEGMRPPMRMICQKHGEFWQIPRNHITLRAGCPKCANSVSKGEVDIGDYIRSHGFAVTVRDRNILGRQEIDILVPDVKLGIEYCGLYWHGEHHKGRDYHVEKLCSSVSAGYSLLTIFEDEWLFQREKVQAQILKHLGAAQCVGARSTEVVELAWDVASDFLDSYHMQGVGKPPRVSYGLTLQGELVAVMTFGKDRFSPAGDVEIYRYCVAPGLKISGGLKKLLIGFLRDYPETKRIVTFADLRWGTGEGYGRVGFTRLDDTSPGYFWCKGSRRFSRQRFQKHKLGGILDDFDPEKTEVENCHANGYWRIYDCGMSKWEYVNG